MPYVPKTDWQYNDVLSEKDMNRIEGGIAEGKQLIDAHAADKNNPHGVTPAQIGAETPTAAQTKVDAHANKTTAAHKASAIAIDDTANKFVANNVEAALSELFTSVDNGKAQVAAAVIEMGGTVAGTAPHSFQELADGVSVIKVGDYSRGQTVPLYTLLGMPLIAVNAFTPESTWHFHAVSEDSFRARDSSYLYSFTSSGTVWKKSSSTQSPDRVSVLPNGDTYVLMSSSQHQVHRYTAAGVGNLLYVLDQSEALTAFHCDGQFAYTASESGYVTKYELSTQTQKWRVRPATNAQFVQNMRTDSNGNLFACYQGEVSSSISTGPILRKLSASTGETLLSIPLSPSKSSGFGVVFVNHLGHVYATESNTYTLKRIDPVTGSIIWEKTNPAAYSFSILGFDASGNVYCYNGLKNIEKINSNGAVLWTSSDFPAMWLAGNTSNTSPRNAVVGNALFIPRSQSAGSGVVTKLVQEITLPQQQGG